MYGLNNSVCLCCTGNSCFECGSDTFPVLLTRKHIHHHHLSSVILFLIIDYYSCETWSEFFKKRKRQESLVSLMTTDYTIISTRSGFFCDALQNWHGSRRLKRLFINLFECWSEIDCIDEVVVVSWCMRKTGRKTLNWKWKTKRSWNMLHKMTKDVLFWAMFLNRSRQKVWGEQSDLFLIVCCMYLLPISLSAVKCTFFFTLICFDAYI